MFIMHDERDWFEMVPIILYIMLLSLFMWMVYASLVWLVVALSDESACMRGCSHPRAVDAVLVHRSLSAMKIM